ncbi:ACP phosphodiesterase [Pedobacter nyackensis]|nr:ACP phosphodiesterase [Pedobacter nyackensis]
MNFLSHFYFERNNPDENMVLGVVLPDFIKNAKKDYNLYPLKIRHLFEDEPHQISILNGWKKHIEVDQIFHSSKFFQQHTAELKQLILPSCENSPVKPFFLAHIGLELVLDHLLATEGLVNINTFYDQLSRANKTALNDFLHTSSLNDTDVFFSFLNSFISSRYLFSYQKVENIAYALNRICMRLWNNPFSEEQLHQLTGQLEEFKNHLKNDYLSIFNDIEGRLK